MKLTNELESEIMQVMDTYWSSYLKGDLETWASFLPEDYRNIGTTQEEIWNSKQDIVDYSLRFFDQIVGQADMRNKQTQIIPMDPYLMVHEIGDLYIKTGSEWAFYAKLRMSSLLERAEDGWKILHQHGSYPDAKAEEGEAFAFEKISKENQELRDAVKRRTIELEHKNQELELESSLERVRNRALLMKDSRELNEVVSVFFQQFAAIGLLPKHARTYFCHIHEDHATAQVWMTHADGTVMEGSHVTPLDQSASLLKCFEDWKRKVPVSIRIYKEQGLQDYIAFLSTLPHVAADPDYQKLFSQPPGQIMITDAHFLQGNIGIMTLEPLPQEALDLLVRFAKAFEFAYTRFLDLKKAESQAREAQIEAALEKVRARTMGMQHSEELKDAAALLFRQVKALGVPAFSCGYNIWDKGEKECTAWMSTIDGTGIDPAFRIPLTEEPNFIRFYESRQNGEEFYVLEMRGERMQEHYRYLRENIAVFRETFDNLEKAGYPLPETQIHHLVNFSHGNLMFITLEPCPDAHDIFKRFAGVFEQTYTRFLDLQKAESQAREAQIQLSLERVRSRAMAMHHSDEISDVLSVLFEQFDVLNISPMYTFLSLIDLDKGNFLYRQTGRGGQRVIAQQVIDIHAMDVWKDVVDRWTAANYDVVETMHVAKEYVQEVFDVYAEIYAALPEGAKVYPEDFPDGMYATIAASRFGHLGYDHFRPSTEEEKSILLRFNTEFVRLYQRFLDLQKAESQSRESQIELGLERVRARSMAMHKSEELGNLSLELVKQVQALGVATWFCAFNIYDDDPKGSLEWGSNGQGTFPRYRTPREGVFLRYYEAGQRGEKLLINEILEHECGAHYEYLCSLPGVGDQLLKMKEAGLAFPTSQIDHVAFFRYGYIIFITYEPVPEAHDIFKRFASVFEQTYTRFLDLQKAEAQVREAQIEAALERVRSRSMAMQQSSELKEVIKIVYQQLRHLHIHLDHAGFVVDYTPGGDWHFWIADKQDIPAKISHPYFESVWANQFNEAKESGADFFVTHLDFEEKNKFYSELLSYVPGLPEASKAFYLSCPGLSATTVLFDNVSLYMENFSGTPYTAEENATLMRFGKVFQQTYTRFLDLQKAEAQAREAQIEAAVERVRAQSMAMHRTEDLNNVTQELLNQLNKLNVDGLTGTSIYLVDANDIVTCWDISSPGSISDPGSYLITYDAKKYPILGGWVETLKTSNEDYFVLDFPRESLLKGVVEMSEISPEMGVLLQTAIDSGKLTHQWSPVARLSKGILAVDLTTPPTEDTKIIVTKMASAFNQAYQRFLDLQKAEALAREAQIEAALERVRAQTMAMHNSEDIGKCVVKMFAELTAFGVDEGTRFGIGILNHENENNQLWTAKKVGEEVIMHIGRLDMGSHPLLKSAREAWKAQVPIHRYVLEGEDLVNYYQMLNNAPDYKIQIPIEKLPKKEIQHCFIFEHGFFYAFTPHEFQTDLIHITSRFSSLFEQTYRRYLDLVRAEEQAREAEIELALERVRARTMAMHHSDELADAGSLVFQQLNHLGIRAESSWLWFIDLEKDEVEIWTTHENRLAKPVRIDPVDLPTVQQEVEAWKNNVPFLKLRLAGAEAVQVIRRFFGIEISNDGNSEYFHLLQIRHSHGFLGLGSWKEATENEIKLYTRFAKVFEQTYTRFLDLQKAEAQAREAQVETALEKVRSRAAAMQKSDELLQVIQTLSEQLRQLGLHAEAVSFLTDGDERGYNMWLSSPGEDFLSRIFVPRIQDRTTLLFQEAKESGKKYYSYVLSKEEKDIYFRNFFDNTVLKDYPDNGKEQVFAAPGLSTTNVLLDSIILSVSNFTTLPFSDQENEIIIRIASVFQQSYTRFLDLKRAEAQAREARIEAALERVRSRSLAMHHSSELSAVVDTLLREFTNLEFSLTFCIINLINEQDKSNTVWAANPETGKDPESYYMKFEDYPFHHAMWDAWKAQKKHFIYTIAGEEKRTYDEYLYTKTEFRRFPKHVQEANKALERYVAGFTFFKYSGLQTVSENPISEAELDILERFGRVFEQSYTRFLDLQKAEAQAREAQIEAALERVRSRTMAMQRSEELQDSAMVLFQQVETLGLPPFSCGFNIWDDDRKAATAWMGSVGGLQPPFKTDSSRDIYLPILEAAQRGESLFVIEQRGKELEIHYEYLASIPTFRDEIMPNLDRLGISLPTFQIIHCAFFSRGYLMFISYESVPDYYEIFKRFAKVFEQTYTRFLDLKRAEAQARQAQIEAAMEKIRARSLAMQKPEELIVVAEVMRKEMGLLGVEELETSSIYIHDDASGTTGCWFAIKDASRENQLIADQMTMTLQDTAVGQKMLAFYRSPEGQTSIPMKGAERKEWIHYCAAHAPIFGASGFYGESIPDRNYHLCKFSNGFIGAASPGNISAESWDLLQRSASVFSLAYTRFSDLLKAEENSRNAVRQASLDRVRADIASMRSTADLERITPLMWKELTTLGIPFIRCGVFIIDETKGNIQSFLSTPDGKAIAAFDLSLDKPGNLTEAIHSWREGKRFITRWVDSDFQFQAEMLVQQGAMSSTELYLSSIPAEGIHLHFLPFLQGMLYVGNTTALTGDDLEIVQDLADSFSVAYARYEDFKQLEDAKRNIEITLTELKATQTQLIQSEKMASLGELTAGIAHEIQNPLNFVNNFSEVSQELLDEMKAELGTGNAEEALAIADDVKQNLEKIHHHGKRADEIVKGMLQHSRSSSGIKEPTDINALADEYLRLAYHGLRAKDKSFNAKFETDFDECLDKVNVVPQDMGRVILNLINNAFYAVTQKRKMLLAEEEISTYEPRVRVVTRKEGEHVLISVVDNGTGIPLKVVDKMFQPFFTTKPTGQGTGLGLSLSYDIVTKGHGGSLKVETKEGEGSTFIIELPA